MIVTSCAEHRMEVPADESSTSTESTQDLATESITAPPEGLAYYNSAAMIQGVATMKDASSPATVQVAQQVASTPTTPAPSVYSNGKKVIKTANVRFQVKDVNETMRALEPIIIRYNSYVASSDLELDYPNLENKMSIRVPSEHFDNLMRELDQQSIYVNFRNITTQDVSKEFVDLESRLKTKREVEQRYMEILRKKTGTIEDVLAAEEKIGYLHEEIEATIARVNFLRDQVTYSTINLEFYQILKDKVVAEEETGFFQQAGTSMMVGWNALRKITLALLSIWPVLLFFGGAIYLILRKRKVIVESPVKS